jgi:hypothetical protein
MKKFFSRYAMKTCAIFLVLFYMSCSQTGSQSVYQNTSQTCTAGSAVTADASNSNPLTFNASDANAVSITVGCGYANEPCVSVTICTPGSGGATHCQTIPNLLLDTGSYGLRIFDNATTTLGATVSTTNLTSVNSLYECVSYLDGYYQWGQVMRADVTLGTKVAQNVPIQIIESNPSSPGGGKSAVPSACVNQIAGVTGTADSSASGYNGILGVGLHAQDCQGGVCDTQTNNGMYFSCSGSTCSGATATLSATATINQQVTNPVYFMPSSYNNGVAIQLNQVSDQGQATSAGYMLLGVGTAANNTPPSSVKIYSADSDGNFRTTFGGQSYSNAFIDSGSNGLFFPDGCLNIDSSTGFFAPSSTVGFSAVQKSSSNTNPTTINFNVFNASATSAGIKVFNNLAGDAGGNYFDWGLPFFLGRTVYVGLWYQSATLPGNTATVGPYWAY